MLLRDGGWHHLNLSAIAQQDEEIRIGPGVVHRRRAGEALQPEREPLEVLEWIKQEMGSLPFSAQYLQRPIPLEGNLIKRAWIQWYDNIPGGPGGEVVQSWDIASTIGNDSDYSVCTTWWKYQRLYYLLDVWRGRLEFPKLRRKVVALAREHKANRILIEKVGPGLHLLQEFRANAEFGVPMPIGIMPEGDKRWRMEAQSARLEAGQVYLPKQASWLDDLLHEILAFPNSRHDDQVDSLSQLLNWAESQRPPTTSFYGPIVVHG
jgi:predicted phage terminase large subunit-like protein